MSKVMQTGQGGRFDGQGKTFQRGDIWTFRHWPKCQKDARHAKTQEKAVSGRGNGTMQSPEVEPGWYAPEIEPPPADHPQRWATVVQKDENWG